MSYDAVIIGGGVSGLTSALLLSHFGQRVAVVERAAVSAPLIRGFRHGGVPYDTGFHYAGGLGEGEVLDRFLRFLGLSGQLTTVPFNSAGFDRLLDVERGFSFEFPCGEQSLRQALAAEFPQDRPAIDTFVRQVLAICDNLPYLNPRQAFGREEIFDSVQDVSLYDYLQRLTPNRQLQHVLSLHCLLHGVAPQQIPFRLHAAVVGPYFRSVHGFSGGGEQLAKAFDHALQQAGVDVYCRSAVRSIDVSLDRSVSGVELESGQMLKCRVVVNAADPRLLLSWLPQQVLRPVYRRRLNELQETSSAYILFARTAKRAPLLSRRNLYLSSLDSGAQLCPDELERRPFYLTATGDGECCGVMGIMPAPFSEVERWQSSRLGRRPDAYRQFKNCIQQRLLERLQRSVPELAAQLEEPFVATPLTLRDYMHSARGAVYGIQHQVSRYPLQATTRVGGLFLSGQALVAPGLMGAMVGAFYTCGAIVGHERILEELNRCNATE